MNHYEIVVNFDDRTAGQTERKTYFDFVDKYNAAATGHERTRTSTLCITTDEVLTLERVTEELPGLKIRAFLDKANLANHK